MAKSDEYFDKAKASSKGKEETGTRRRSSHRSSNVADWATCDSGLLQTAIASIAGMGGAVRLGYTRDGGAYSIGIYGDGDPFTEYLSPNDDLDEFLRGLIRDYGK